MLDVIHTATAADTVVHGHEAFSYMHDVYLDHDLDRDRAVTETVSVSVSVTVTVTSLLYVTVTVTTIVGAAMNCPHQSSYLIIVYSDRKRHPVCLLT